MFRILRKLIVLGIVAGVTLYFAGYEIKGKTVRQHFIDAYKSGLISEGLKDIKTWIADIFKMGKKMTGDELTAKDREALERIIKNELKENVMRLKEEAEKKEDERGKK